MQQADRGRQKEKGVDVDEEPVSRYVQRADVPRVWRGHRDGKKQGANKSWLDCINGCVVRRGG